MYHYQHINESLIDIFSGRTMKSNGIQLSSTPISTPIKKDKIKVTGIKANSVRFINCLYIILLILSLVIALLLFWLLHY